MDQPYEKKHPSVDSYLTVDSRHACEIKIERSRFIGTVVPVDSRLRAETEHDAICRQYYDATHNCFAYQVGREANLEYRYSDDGEPSGTAGRPIQDAIQSHGLSNVLVVVTRYFGGIKLGTGGLARAYRLAADQALREAKIVEVLILQSFRIEFDHEQTSVVMRTCSEFEVRPVETKYSERVTLLSSVRMSRYEEFCETMRERTHGRVIVERISVPNA